MYSIIASSEPDRSHDPENFKFQIYSTSFFPPFQSFFLSFLLRLFLPIIKSRQWNNTIVKMCFDARYIHIYRIGSYITSEFHFMLIRKKIKWLAARGFCPFTCPPAHLVHSFPTHCSNLSHTSQSLAATSTSKGKFCFVLKSAHQAPHNNTLQRPRATTSYETTIIVT